MLVSKLTTLLSNSISFNQFKQIQALILINGLNRLEPLLIHHLLCCNLSYSRITSDYVQLILHHSKHPDAFSWSFIIRFFSQHGRFKDAFSHYIQMQRLGLRPSSFAISSSLRACARISEKIGGNYVHGQVCKFGFCRCVYVQTALVDFYSKLGEIAFAQRVFDDMVEKNIVSWNSILSGYVKSGNLKDAQKVFDEMPEKDIVSWNCMLSWYSSRGNMDKACSLFEKMAEKNSASWNIMISGYTENGDMESACKLFDEMPQRNNVSRVTMISGYGAVCDVGSARELFDRTVEKDLITYNAMISCYAQNSLPKECLNLFNRILELELTIHPDKMTLSSVVSACSQLSDYKFGFWIESYAKNLGIELDDHLATAFIDLYAKCGFIDKANELFQGLGKKDLVAYSAMISGFGINGRISEAIVLFEEMATKKISPNLVTFTGLLTAYNHAGLVEGGKKCFNSMKDYGLVASADHYAIMVDLLGRAGRVDEAYNLINSMPTEPHVGVWGALLLACRLHNNVEVGEIAAYRCFELEPGVVGYYSLLLNIYSSIERWDNAKRLRKVMDDKFVSKIIPGCSWIE